MTKLIETLEAFNDDFSNQRLEQVLDYFSEDCEWQELNGKIARGKPQLKKALQRTFFGPFGQMTFIGTHMVVDEEKAEASFVWRCQHTINETTSLSGINRVVNSIIKVFWGKEFYWQGADYFLFNKDGKITSKQTYAKTSMPKFIRGLVKQ